MSEHDDRCAGFQVLHVVFQPFELLGPKRSQPACLQIHHVHQSDEVHASFLEAVPSSALAALPVALKELLSVVI